MTEPELLTAIYAAYERERDMPPFSMPRETALLYDQLNKVRGLESPEWLTAQLASGVEMVGPEVPAFMEMAADKPRGRAR